MFFLSVNLVQRIRAAFQPSKRFTFIRVGETFGNLARYRPVYAASFNALCVRACGGERVWRAEIPSMKEEEVVVRAMQAAAKDAVRT